MATSLDWYGCATFALRTAAGAADDVEECDWILVGHSHFDPLYGAERIARRTGARIVGSYETVRIMAEAGVPLDELLCAAGGEPGAAGAHVRHTGRPGRSA
mgnify:CR=1 FL=1